jgi:hypothetical protein
MYLAHTITSYFHLNVYAPTSPERLSVARFRAKLQYALLTSLTCATCATFLTLLGSIALTICGKEQAKGKVVPVLN